VNTAEAARRWASEWERGWREHDVERIAALYAEGPVHRSAPFREPHGARWYAEWAFSDEDSAEPHFGEPIVSGDQAIVEWWAVSTSGGKEETLAGVSLIRFDKNGLVAEQRDYWHIEPGRSEL
jgi:ketosteroid isomerase-like protein